MKMKNYTAVGLIGISALIAFSTACSTAKVRVLPGENGLNRVSVRDIERDDAEEAALDAANDYCKDQKKKAVFVNDSTKYTGTMNEGTRGTIRKASKAAVILGGAGSVPSDTRTAGAILGSAGVVGGTMTSDRDYQSEMTFKCQ